MVGTDSQVREIILVISPYPLQTIRYRKVILYRLRLSAGFFAVGDAIAKVGATVTTTILMTCMFHGGKFCAEFGDRRVILIIITYSSRDGVLELSNKVVLTYDELEQIFKDVCTC
jgi:hypothetical protein